MMYLAKAPPIYKKPEEPRSTPIRSKLVDKAKEFVPLPLEEISPEQEQEQEDVQVREIDR